MIEYKGYTGVFEFDPSIDAFHGHVIGLQDVVTFEGRSVEELRNEMGESVEDYLVSRHQIDARRITTEGRGPADPVASNDTAAGRKQNRRAVVILRVE